MEDVVESVRVFTRKVTELAIILVLVLAGIVGYYEKGSVAGDIWRWLKFNTNLDIELTDTFVTFCGVLMAGVYICLTSVAVSVVLAILNIDRNLSDDTDW